MLFDIISPIYGLFFNYQLKYFEKIFEKTKNDVDFSKYKTVLDIGCGTGALCKILYEEGLEVVGVDPSKGMINQARKKSKNLPIKFMQIQPGEKLPFEDKSFDIAITSYVAHGLQKDERIKLYKEMKRLAKKIIIIHDYNQTRSIMTNIVEWLERGDYFNFIKFAEQEMNNILGNIKVKNVDTRASWYISII